MIVSGASFHVTAHRDYFTFYVNGDYGHVRIGNEGASKILGMEIFAWQLVLAVSYSLRMFDMYHIFTLI